MRRPLLVLLLALFVLPGILPAQAQSDSALSLLGLARSGDKLQVTIRANVALEDVTVRLVADGAVVGLPDWFRDTWRRGATITWEYTLLRDATTASLEWDAEEETNPISGTIGITLPPAGFDDPLTLVGVERTGGAVVVALQASENLTDFAARLVADGAVAGFPEWRRAQWDADEREEWSFDLLREITDATLAWQAKDDEGTLRTGSIEVIIPAETAGAQPRLVITGATLTASTATITVTNYGDAAARNVVVSIEDAQEKRIASPLTALLASLAAGQRASTEFTLLADVTDVVVVLDHANTTTRTPLTLRKLDANGTADPGTLNVTMTTDLPFREVDLGRSADYAVQVKNGGAPALVQLRVDGLPQGYSARFFVGGSAVPSLYLDRNQTRQVTMSITVPSARTEVDRTVDFTTVATINGTEAAKLAMGVAVRGVGTLEASSSDSEAAIPAGGQATFQVTIRNGGSAPVFNVELDSRRPYGWTVRVEPRRVDRIDPGESAAVSVEVRAPDVLGSGRYSVDVAAKSGDLTSRYVPLALSVDEAEGGGGWVWGVMLALIAGVLGFAAWWKWKG